MSDPRDITSIGEQLQRELIDILQRRAMADGQAGLRQSVRYPVTTTRGFIMHRGEGPNEERLNVLPVDISEGGCNVLLGMFVYPGTRCVMELRSPDGERLLTPGRVVRCTLVRGRVHEAGVQFDANINIESFSCKPAAASRSADPAWDRAIGILDEFRTAVDSRDRHRCAKMMSEISEWYRSLATFGRAA